MSSVKVAVRVRPFNQREKDLGAVCCVSMAGNTTTISDLEGVEKSEPRTFAFDYSYWSHDGYEEIDGYCRPLPGSNYADQSRVFNELGKEVLDNAWDGYHACLFAYGQTGAGKSYSMVGYGKNRGIVPTACEEIFSRIAANQETEKTFEVRVGMLEIYNECVQDLLCSPTDRPKGGLEIRESKQLGVFVEGLTKTAVSSYEEIRAVTDRGTANRTGRPRFQF
ncbi:hypothetical protein Efla_001594 [Eimeria flavescens]